MDFGSILASFLDYLASTPIYVPIISFVIILIVFLINKKYFWTVPKVTFVLALIVSVYEVVAKTPGGGIFEQIKAYFKGSDYSSGFYYFYLPLFIFSFIFAILFSIFNKIMNKIDEKVNKLPR